MILVLGRRSGAFWLGAGLFLTFLLLLKDCRDCVNSRVVSRWIRSPPAVLKQPQEAHNRSDVGEIFANSTACVAGTDASEWIFANTKFLVG
jgi:hypothetical protein